MAAGDVTVFEEFALNVGDADHDLASDTIKLGLIDSTTSPTASDATPTWSDYSANEVSASGGYTSGGITLASKTWSEAAGVGTLDADDISLAQDGSGFTNARWGIIYNDTEGSDKAIAFLDLGADVSEQAGPVNINWGSSGIIQITVQ